MHDAMAAPDPGFGGESPLALTGGRESRGGRKRRRSLSWRTSWEREGRRPSGEAGFLPQPRCPSIGSGTRVAANLSAREAVRRRDDEKSTNPEEPDLVRGGRRGGAGPGLGTLLGPGDREEHG